MATSVHDLDLPTVDTTLMDRDDALVAIAEARDRHWLARTPLGYSVSRQADCVSLLRDRRFHNALSLLRQMNGLEPDEDTDPQRRSILAMEGDDHARLRRLVAPAFTPQAADRLRPFMRDVVGGLVDGFHGSGRCEVVVDLCEPYPIPIICELLGAPKDDWRQFSAWATDIFRIFNQNLGEDLPLVEAAGAALEEYLAALIAERRATPGHDLLSDLIAVEEAGDRLSTPELVSLAVAVLMAGTDTTRNQLACALALFAEYPDQWALLAEQPELAPRAVEEAMRYLGAVRGTVRFAPEDIVFRDVLFPKGTLVFVSLAGANRDPGTYEVPETFDITRERRTQQMTFGSGIHHCMGAALARAELQEALVLLSRRMADLSTDGPVEWKPTTFGIWGPARLPLRFTPVGPETGRA
jgi:cytochrome P450